MSFSNVKLLWRSEGSRSQTIEVPAPLSDTKGNIGGRSLMKHHMKIHLSPFISTQQPNPKNIVEKDDHFVRYQKSTALVYCMSFRCSTFLLDFAAQVPLLPKLPHVVSSLSLSMILFMCLSADRCFLPVVLQVLP